jgi:hypothetical protein
LALTIRQPSISPSSIVEVFFLCQPLKNAETDDVLMTRTSFLSARLSITQKNESKFPLPFSDDDNGYYYVYLGSRYNPPKLFFYPLIYCLCNLNKKSVPSPFYEV